MSNATPALSIVCTGDPDAGVMAAMLQATHALAARHHGGCELLVVDDLGVVDAAQCAQSGAADVRLLRPPAPAGQLAAMLHGIALARAPCVLAIDADMHANLADVPRLLAALQAGHELVYGWRRQRADTAPWRRAASWLANGLLRRIAGLPLHDLNTPLVMLSAHAVYALRHEVPPGLAPKLYLPLHFGAHCTEVAVQVRGNATRRSSYGPRRLLVLFAQALGDALRLRAYRQRHPAVAR